jgi:hypothetical protein
MSAALMVCGFSPVLCSCWFALRNALNPVQSNWSDRCGVSQAFPQWQRGSEAFRLCRCASTHIPLPHDSRRAASLFTPLALASTRCQPLAGSIVTGSPVSLSVRLMCGSSMQGR